MIYLDIKRRNYLDTIFAFALTHALFNVAEVISTKIIVEPSITTAFEPFIDWLKSGHDKLKASKELRSLHMKALDMVRANTQDVYDSLKITNWVTGNTDEVYLDMALATVEMSRADPLLVPDKLLSALSIDEENRNLFAKYLYSLRAQLKSSEQFKNIIDYCDHEIIKDELNIIKNSIEDISFQNLEMVNTIKESNDILEQLAEHFGIGVDKKKAINRYKKHYITQWSKLAIPLIRKNIGIFSPDIKQIFVPLEVQLLEDKKYSSSSTPQIIPARNRLEDVRYDNVKKGNFFSFFKNYDRFVLIGLPGSGKSTLFRRIALAFAESNEATLIDWEKGDKLPIYIRLRNLGIYLSSNKDKHCEPSAGILIQYLLQHLQNDENLAISDAVFEEFLGEGKCIVLLDGLDEVQENRVEVAQIVNAFITKYGGFGNWIGISSRPKGFEGDTRLQLSRAKLSVFEVLPLSIENIKILINNILLLIETKRTTRDQDYRKLCNCILENKNLKTIAGIPLFCSALVQVYKYHGAELPQRRVDILEEISDLLLGFWYAQASEIKFPERLAQFDGTERNYDDTEESIEAKFNRLSYLAFIMQDEIKEIEIKSEYATSILQEYLHIKEGLALDKAMIWAKQFLRGSHLHSGIFVEYTPGYYSFLHKSFLEYFAASSLLSDNEEPLKIVMSHLDDTWWDEVLLLTASHSKATNIFREKVISAIIESAQRMNLFGQEKRILFAGKMASDMTTRLPAKPKKQIIEELVKVSSNSCYAIKNRVSCAKIADELGYSPEDQYTFSSILDEQNNEYMISRYPVTNAQYARFLQPENFLNIHFWTNFPLYSAPDCDGKINYIGDTGNDGWMWLQKVIDSQDEIEDDFVLCPRFWNSIDFGARKRNSPVVGISWWEANAYCKWLFVNWDRQQEGLQGNPKPLKIRLPNENEWQYAAQYNNKKYPWGSIRNAEEIKKFANTSLSNIQCTTPVWMFIQGESKVYRLMDLAGNTWEWQANYYQPHQNWISLRGGSWAHRMEDAEVYDRTYVDINKQYDHIGFRVFCEFAPI